MRHMFPQGLTQLRDGARLLRGGAGFGAGHWSVVHRGLPILVHVKLVRRREEEQDALIALLSLSEGVLPLGPLASFRAAPGAPLVHGVPGLRLDLAPPALPTGRCCGGCPGCNGFLTGGLDPLPLLPFLPLALRPGALPLCLRARPAVPPRGGPVPSASPPRMPKRPSPGRVKTEFFSLRFTSVYSAEAIVASGVFPEHCSSPRRRATLVISPVDISRRSRRSTRAAAFLKIPPGMGRSPSPPAAAAPVSTPRLAHLPFLPRPGGVAPRGRAW